jgi:hypothetical protein
MQSSCAGGCLILYTQSSSWGWAVEQNVEHQETTPSECSTLCNVVSFWTDPRQQPELRLMGMFTYCTVHSVSRETTCLSNPPPHRKKSSSSWFGCRTEQKRTLSIKGTETPPVSSLLLTGQTQATDRLPRCWTDQAVVTELNGVTVVYKPLVESSTLSAWD